ncbi:MAG: RNA-directed DNA polymerase, partial [Bacteroidales bacterium]
ERIICAASFKERVMHHAIMNVCHPIFEKKQIFDSYASRKAKGSHKAIDRAYFFSKNNQWFLKLDVRKFFDSVDHQVLKGLLTSIFKDPSLLSLFEDIIDSYQVGEGRGLPIGNLTSQYFANHYLSVSDRVIKETYQIKAYVRYMDDMLLFHNNKNILKKVGDRLISFLARELRLQVKPICLNACRKGIPFLGYVIFPNQIHLSARSKERVKNIYFDCQRLFESGNEQEAATKMRQTLNSINKMTQKLSLFEAP